MPIPDEMRWLFWDVDPGDVDLERDADWVLARVLERGRLRGLDGLVTRGRTRTTGRPGPAPS